MKSLLNRLFSGEKLTEQESYNILTEIGEGKHNHAQIASFLTVFLMRPVTAAELSGFRNALLDLAVKVDLSDYNTIDLCGTGGDGKNTFNISTLTSFIVAGTGQKVAKHGNYGVSSISGSSNMLEYFGYKFTNDASALKQQVEEAGICFLHAPLFHPAMKHVGPVRKELQLKTIFNLLGPIVNPTSPGNQLVGVYNRDILKLYGELFAGLDKNYTIVFSADGYDEISLTSDFYMIDKDGEHTVNPKDIGLPLYPQEALHGGSSIEASGKLFRTILEGKGTEAQNNVVLTNAAYALKTVNPLSFEDAFETAKESLQSGKALVTLEKLIVLS